VLVETVIRMTSASRRHEARRASLYLGAICALTLLAYGNSFQAAFQYDDYPHIIDNAAVKNPSIEAFAGFARTRILPFATLALNYQVGGEDPFGYHLVNFAIHLLATLAVFGLVGALCATPRLQGTWLARNRLALAASTAFVFACHPIQIQAVTYIVQRMSSMVTLFYVGSVYFYARARNAQLGLQNGRSTWLFTAAGLCAIGAFFSKENSVSLPLAILLVELTFYPGQAGSKRLLRLTPFLLLVALVPLTWYLFGKRPGRAPALDAPLLEQARYFIDLLSFRAFPRREISVLQYALTQCTVIPRYLGLVLLPWGFNIDHDIPIASGFSTPVVAGLVFLAALLACGLYFLRRQPVIGFAIVWLFLALSVESSFLPIQDVMVEHRMYLAMPGVGLLCGLAFVWLLNRWRHAAVVLGAVVGVTLCILTFQRNQAWSTPLALWQDALAKSPEKARVYVNVGTALHKERRIDEAISYYCKALEVRPDYKLAQANLNAVVEEQLDANAKKGVVHLDMLEMGEDGTLTLTPPDPCKRKR
jgi:tetratricopeptide (TPR) repeat protein